MRFSRLSALYVLLALVSSKLYFFIQMSSQRVKLSLFLSSLAVPLMFCTHYMHWMYLFTILVAHPALSVIIGPKVPLALFVYLACVIYYLFQSPRHSVRRFFHPHTYELVLLSFILICLCSIMQSVFIPIDGLSIRHRVGDLPFIRSIVIFIYYASFILVAYSFRFIIGNHRQLESLIKTFLIYGSILCSAGIYAWFTKLYSFLPTTRFIRSLVATPPLGTLTFIKRITLTYYEPSICGRYVAALVFLALLLFPKNKRFYGGLIALFITTLCLTFSRSSLLTLGLSSALVIMLSFIYSRKKLVILTISGFVVSSIVLGGMMAYQASEQSEEFINTMVLNVFSASDEDYAVKDLSASIRLTETHIISKVLHDYPVFGIGIGNLPFHSHIYNEYIPWFTDHFGIIIANISNLYGQIAIETGYFGASFFILFCILLFIRLLVCYLRLKDPELRHIFLCLIGLLTTLLIHGFFYSGFLLDYWLFMGIIFYYSHHVYELEQDTNPSLEHVPD